MLTTPQARRVKRTRASRRLLDFPARDTCSISIEPKPAPASSKLTAIQQLDKLKAYEVCNWVLLVKDGGRPCYPLDLTESVGNDPDNYRDILSPWLDGDDWKVFGIQLMSWEKFRLWQKYSRGKFSDISTQDGLYDDCEPA